MATPIQNIHAPERHPAPLIDACMMGWVRGVVKPQGGLVAFEGEDMVPQITKEDLTPAKGYGIQNIPGVLTKLYGSHDWPHVALELPGQAPLDLWELVRPHIAWTCRDPDVVFRPEAHRDALDDGEYLGQGLADLYRTVGGLILRARALLLPFCTRRVPVIVEGGLHLYARCIREAARGLGLPVWAIENTWIPGWALMSRGGIAVNSFGHEYRQMRDELLPLQDRDELLDWIDKKTSEEAGVGAYARRYPWMYSEEENLEEHQKGVADLAELYDEPREQARICVLVLGQVPYDASVVADNPHSWSVSEMVQATMMAFLSHSKQGITIIYRPHPMEEASRISDLRSEELSIPNLLNDMLPPQPVYSKERPVCFVISDPRRSSLSAQLAAHEGPVVTINSQAGLQACLSHPTVVLGRAFYSQLGLTWSHPRELASRWDFVGDQVFPFSSGKYRTDERPHNRWARYVSFLLRRCYADKEKLRTPEGFLRALSHRAQDKVPPWSRSFLPPWRSA